MRSPEEAVPGTAGSRAGALRAASLSLAQLLDRDERAQSLLGEDRLPDAAGFSALVNEALQRGGLPEVRLEKRRLLLVIAAHDLSGELDLEQAGVALSDLADACLHVSLGELDDRGELAVVGMGKLGARELNYVSDIDLMFATSGDTRYATRVAERLLSELGSFSPQGQPFVIDANLRPEGRSGPLVRSLDSYLEYYAKWAKPWEHQALIKARPVAGDIHAAAELVGRTRELVYAPEISPERVASIRKIKERVEGHAARTARRARSSENDDVKLGPGGIRDIEFSVQLLQLVHGGAEESLRVPATLPALRALVDGGFIADDDAAGLAVAYRWLRTVEHRIQLRNERRLHVIPSAPAERAELARILGFRDTPAASARDAFESRHRGVLTDVRARFEKLFYRPMVETLAAGPSTARLSEEALGDRLRLLGFRDVRRASQTLHGLVTGTTRRAKLVRVIAPAMLRFLAATPSPDIGLFAFLRLAEALEGRPDVLGALRDNPVGLRTFARLLGSGRVLGDVLVHVPEELAEIAAASDPAPTTRDQVVNEARASLRWRDPRARWQGLRRFKRRQMLRIAVADVGDVPMDVEEVGRSLSHLADACLEAALEEAPTAFGIVGMGKLGGEELSYASDIDVMFVYDGDREAALKFAEGLVRAVGEVTPEGQAFNIDLGLRPEGKSGPLVRSLASYAEYLERWARPWELQAYLKARPAAGNADLASDLVGAMRRRLSAATVDAAFLGEIRHLKARMERERIPRGQDPRRNLKLGPGGLSDIEFAAQLLQLTHLSDEDLLRERSTLGALRVAAQAGCLPEGDARVLQDAYLFLARLRNRLFLMEGRPVDALPTRPEDLEACGIAMGLSDQPRQELEELYLRHTRRARVVAERLIYGG